MNQDEHNQPRPVPDDNSMIFHPDKQTGSPNNILAPPEEQSQQLEAPQALAPASPYSNAAREATAAVPTRPNFSTFHSFSLQYGSQKIAAKPTSPIAAGKAAKGGKHGAKGTTGLVMANNVNPPFLSIRQSRPMYRVPPQVHAALQPSSLSGQGSSVYYSLPSSGLLPSSELGADAAGMRMQLSQMPAPALSRPLLSLSSLPPSPSPAQTCAPYPAAGVLPVAAGSGLSSGHAASGSVSMPAHSSLLSSTVGAAGRPPAHAHVAAALSQPKSGFLSIDASDQERIHAICLKIDESFKDCVLKIKYPDLKTPFQSMEDAQERLMPYHLLSFTAPSLALQDKSGREKYSELESKVMALESRWQSYSRKSAQTLVFPPELETMYAKMALHYEKSLLAKSKEQLESLKSTLGPESLSLPFVQAPDSMASLLPGTCHGASSHLPSYQQQVQYVGQPGFAGLDAGYQSASLAYQMRPKNAYLSTSNQNAMGYNMGSAEHVYGVDAAAIRPPSPAPPPPPSAPSALPKPQSTEILGGPPQLAVQLSASPALHSSQQPMYSVPPAAGFSMATGQITSVHQSQQGAYLSSTAVASVPGGPIYVTPQGHPASTTPMYRVSSMMMGRSAAPIQQVYPSVAGSGSNSGYSSASALRSSQAYSMPAQGQSGLGASQATVPHSYVTPAASRALSLSAPYYRPFTPLYAPPQSQTAPMPHHYPQPPSMSSQQAFGYAINFQQKPAVVYPGQGSSAAATLSGSAFSAISPGYNAAYVAAASSHPHSHAGSQAQAHHHSQLAAQGRPPSEGSASPPLAPT